MTFSAGTHIGPYEILEPLGAGGMGEVYRARDAKLNRDVAIKVLPELFSVDRDRLARFQREAQVLASLNHQNIGHIYGIEDQSGVHALVLELVEGPTLADRIAQGALPLDEAIPIARQIADALECAHEQGIIHRDLKPANIKLRPDGMVKVLDFGLAKALDPLSTSGSDAMNSATLTARGTQLGLIVGTAAYMAPEQARGKAVDRRADIWAFGVVLYEMLAGTRPFLGNDVSTTLASVLKDDVDWKILPDLPASVGYVLRRCLDKDPRRRLSAIADARFELEDDVMAGRPAAANTGAPRSVSSWRLYLPWTVAAVASLAAVATLAQLAPWRAKVTARAVRVSTQIGLDGALAVGVGPAAVLSRDGQTIAFVAKTGPKRLLHVRRLSQLQAISLAGTEDAHSPFFSPDGEWIAFFAAGWLKKISVNGGATMTICAAPDGRGGWWGDAGDIVFQPTTAPNALLQRVSADGGTPRPATGPGQGEDTQRWPQILPDGRGVLYTGHAGPSSYDNADIMVQPADGSRPKRVIRGGYHARYVPTGHLVFLQRGTLFAVPFDLNQLAVAGNPVPVEEGVLGIANTGGVQFSIAESGTLLYIAGARGPRETPVWTMDSTGRATMLRVQPAEWFQPRYSHDGHRLAMTIGRGRDADIWIHEAERDLTRFTFERGTDLSPVWTPDSSRIAYASSKPEGTAPNIYWQRSNGTGPVDRLTTSDHFQIPTSFHPSGKFLALTERVTTSNTDVIVVPLGGDEKTGWKAGTPQPFLNAPVPENSGMFSPDGRWLAYVSAESGVPEVYVRPFPSGDSKWKISNGGGVHPRWSPKRNELFYVEEAPKDPVMVETFTQNRVMLVTFRVDGVSFVNSAPRRWSPEPIQPHGQDATYDVHPDGQHVVMIKPVELGNDRDEIVFVFNFFDELRRVAPRK